MATPMGSIIDAIQEQLRTYDPENGADLWLLVQEAPELFDALSTAFASLSLRIAEKPGEMQTITEEFSNYSSLMNDAKDTAEDARDNFKRANDFWINEES
jgi:hypothetical protein